MTLQPILDGEKEKGGAIPLRGRSGALRAERWLSVVGYEGLYEVSNLGRVRSLYSRHRTPKILSLGTDETGYPTVMLSKDGNRKPFTVHRLVALAFHGAKRNILHCQVAHLDGDKTNARADNLKWASKVENESHKRRHGTDQRGEGNGFAKLTEAQVREIKALLGTRRRSQIAEKFGVSQHAINHIARGTRWGHVLPAAIADSRGTLRPTFVCRTLKPPHMRGHRQWLKLEGR